MPWREKKVFCRSDNSLFSLSLSSLCSSGQCFSRLSRASRLFFSIFLFSRSISIIILIFFHLIGIQYSAFSFLFLCMSRILLLRFCFLLHVFCVSLSLIICENKKKPHIYITNTFIQWFSSLLSCH